MDIIKILDRLKTHLRVHTDAEVAGHLKLTKQDLYRYKKDGKVPYNHLMEFAKMESVSVDWLLMGREQVTDSEYKEKYIKQLEKDNNRLEEENRMLMNVIEKLSKGGINQQEAETILEQITN